MNSRLAHAIRATLPSPLVALRLLGLIGAFGEIVSARATHPAIQINTPNGTIRGGRCHETGVDYFLSIPYAKPPVGDLRFAPPVSHTDAYDGILDGRVEAPACPQFGTNFVERGPQDEDWLAEPPHISSRRRSLTRLVCSLMFGSQRVQLRRRGCLSKFGYSAAVTRRGAFLTRPTMAATRPQTR